MPEVTTVKIKCNFCFNSFNSYQALRCSLNVCSACFQKTNSKGCFNVASPYDHFIYQILLIKTPICVSSPKSSLNDNLRMTLEAMDSQCTAKIKQFILKWEMEREKIFKKATIQKQKLLQQNLLQADTYLKQETNSEKQQINPNIKKQANSLKDSKRINNHKKQQKKVVPLNKNNIQKQSVSPTSSLSSSFSMQRDSSLFVKHYMLKPIDHQQEMRLKIVAALEKSNTKPLLVPLKIVVDSILKATEHTFNSNGIIEVVSYNLNDVDFKSYLKVLEWTNVNTVKFVKVGLNNSQFSALLDTIIQYPDVQTLNVSNNSLTNESYEILLSKISKISIKNVYMSNNPTMPFKSRKTIKQIKQKINLYI